MSTELPEYGLSSPEIQQMRQQTTNVFTGETTTYNPLYHLPCWLSALKNPPWKKKKKHNPLTPDGNWAYSEETARQLVNLCCLFHFWSDWTVISLWHTNLSPILWLVDYQGTPGCTSLPPSLLLSRDYHCHWNFMSDVLIFVIYFTDEQCLSVKLVVGVASPVKNARWMHLLRSTSTTKPSRLSSYGGKRGFIVEKQCRVGVARKAVKSIITWPRSMLAFRTDYHHCWLIQQAKIGVSFSNSCDLSGFSVIISVIMLFPVFIVNAIRTQEQWCSCFRQLFLI